MALRAFDIEYRMPKNMRAASSRVTIPGIIQLLYLLSVLAAVLPLGAVHPIPLSLATILSCLVAVISGALFGPPEKTRWLFVAALILTVIVAAWVEMQTLPNLPAGFANPLWHDLERASIGARSTISIQPANSIETLMFMAVPFLTFMTGLVLIRSDNDARKIIATLAVGGALCSVYGLIQFSLFPNTNLFFPKVAYLDSLTATFVNRNTAGTFLGLTCLALLRYTWSLSRDMSWASLLQPTRPDQKMSASKLVFFAFIALMLACSLAALFLTKSRGALASTVVAAICLMGFLAVQKSDKKAGFTPSSFRGKTVFRMLGIVAMIVIVLGAFGGRSLLRMEQQGTDDGRYCVLPGILQLAQSEPLLGYGFGTFRYAFPPYRDPQCGIVYIWDRAHNFYLEGFIGLGLMFVVVAVIGISCLLIAHVVGFRQRRRMRSYSALGFASILLVGLHGLVDFSLEIPGMATYFAALIAATSAISLGKPSEGRSRKTRS